jgi:hypothetical protein
MSSVSYDIAQIQPGSSQFQEILGLRRLAYQRPEAGMADEIDGHSLHFAARNSRGVIGAMRVTLRKDGPLESQEHYPAWILDQFGDSLCAASRMCVHPDFAGATSIPRDLKRFGWPIILPMGARIDVTKARLDAIPFYMRMGYFFVRSSVFRFRRWDAWCGLIAFPAHSRYRNRFSDLFTQIENPCDLDQLSTRQQFVQSFREFQSLTAELSQAS